ncbi:type II secretion system F family protein [Candidatus Peregrinibacteria bacterium]|nr:type II secretion system F family protein [Candidatus Peregrinibacteria bacterium]
MTYVFTINATDAFGNKKRLEIKAETPQKALQSLKTEGFRAKMEDIVDARKDSWLDALKKLDIASKFNRVPKKDILRLIKMLGNSMNRGRTLKESLEFIGENEDSKALKNVVEKLQERMSKPFASQTEVFSVLPQYFDDEFLGIIQAGETSSNIGQYLTDYTEEKKKQMKLTEKFRSVLVSRGITFLMVVGVAIVVVAFVIPQFKQLFGEKMEIPWAMGWMLSFSGLIQHYGIILFMFLGLGASLFYYLVTQNAQVRWWWHDTLLHAPVLGKTLRTFYTAQFAYLLSTLLTKNVDIIKSMDIILKQTHNVCMQQTYKNLVRRMQGGDDLFAAIIRENDEGRGYLIPSIVQAAKVGGATASLGATLLDVRNDLDELFVMRLERAIKAFSAIFYAFIVGCGLFLAYAIGSAIIAFYENAQSLV